MVVSGNSAFTICSTATPFSRLSTKSNILLNEKSKIKERKASSHMYAPVSSSCGIDKISPSFTLPRASLNASTIFSKLYSSSNKLEILVLNMALSKALSDSSMPRI